jgi:hypothetical protein
LLELSDLDRVWLRVSIYAGDLASIDTNANARIAALDDVTGAGAREAEPAGAPPSANPSAASVDLWYSIDNRDGAMVPGQRWNARLPLKSDSDQLALPWPAVVYDIHGGAWVYERVAELRFVRRRVVVERLARTSSGGERAVLAAGPPEGTEIVVAGAAELFGAEFGVGG